jgi:acyl-coenzyme A thioesterase PaaI-like protein
MVTVSLHVTYLAPTTGQRISAEAVITSAGRSLVFADITIRNEDGSTSAQGRATARVFTKPLTDPDVRARENRDTP